MTQVGITWLFIIIEYFYNLTYQFTQDFLYNNVAYGKKLKYFLLEINFNLN